MRKPVPAIASRSALRRYQPSLNEAGRAEETFARNFVASRHASKPDLPRSLPDAKANLNHIEVLFGAAFYTKKHDFLVLAIFVELFGDAQASIGATEALARGGSLRDLTAALSQKSPLPEKYLLRAPDAVFDNPFGGGTFEETIKAE